MTHLCKGITHQGQEWDQPYEGKQRAKIKEKAHWHMHPRDHHYDFLFPSANPKLYSHITKIVSNAALDSKI